ncbi:MAG TPA: hypothetical protein VFT39_04575 [Vicinamibacterales bacterium]|nr:hypothetical protein [Vicinamibacterales bacterium]
MSAMSLLRQQDVRICYWEPEIGGEEEHVLLQHVLECVWTSI